MKVSPPNPLSLIHAFPSQQNNQYQWGSYQAIRKDTRANLSSESAWSKGAPAWWSKYAVWRSPNTVKTATGSVYKPLYAAKWKADRFSMSVTLILQPEKPISLNDYLPRSIKSLMTPGCLAVAAARRGSPPFEFGISGFAPIETKNSTISVWPWSQAEGSQIASGRVPKPRTYPKKELWFRQNRQYLQYLHQDTVLVSLLSSDGPYQDCCHRRTYLNHHLVSIPLQYLPF